MSCKINSKPQHLSAPTFSEKDFAVSKSPEQQTPPPGAHRKRPEQLQARLVVANLHAPQHSAAHISTSTHSPGRKRNTCMVS